MEIHILQLFQGLSQAAEDANPFLAVAQEGTAPWEPPLQQVLNQFSSSLLDSWVLPLSRLILLHMKTRLPHSRTGPRNCSVTNTFFTLVDAKSFQQVALNFLISIPRNSAGLQHLLCLHSPFLFGNWASFHGFSASRSRKLSTARVPCHC